MNTDKLIESIITDRILVERYVKLVTLNYHGADEATEVYEDPDSGEMGDLKKSGSARGLLYHGKLYMWKDQENGTFLHDDVMEQLGLHSTEAKLAWSTGSHLEVRFYPGFDKKEFKKYIEGEYPGVFTRSQISGLRTLTNKAEVYGGGYDSLKGDIDQFAKD